jgi:hypothetical protein
VEAFGDLGNAIERHLLRPSANPPAEQTRPGAASASFCRLARTRSTSSEPVRRYLDVGVKATDDRADSESVHELEDLIERQF